ncbi:hypothetical protein DEO72_LG6g649 [Vigna unguiculata]|uniref:Uncharacterized protein n=1 Tax=Vigna unguiculata TaxID=3917 RepID=A0A4D6M636_VIGUN|nr:hypothetical protein DEO72_LG6g649 [Vigna unguiculata]
MNEDKRCRPILFHSEGSKAGDLHSLQKYQNDVCYYSLHYILIMKGMIEIIMFVKQQSRALTS